MNDATHVAQPLDVDDLIVASEGTRLLVRDEPPEGRPHDRRITVPFGLCHAVPREGVGPTLCGRPRDEFNIFDEMAWSELAELPRCVRCSAAHPLQ